MASVPYYTNPYDTTSPLAPPTATTTSPYIPPLMPNTVPYATNQPPPLVYTTTNVMPTATYSPQPYVADEQQIRLEGDNQWGAQDVPTATDKFAPGAYRDMPFVALFAAHLFATFLIFFIALGKSDTETYNGWIPNVDTNSFGKYFGSFFITGLVGIVTSLLLLVLMRYSPKGFIWFSLVFNLAVVAAAAIAMLAIGQIAGGIVFIIFALLWVWFLYSLVRYIPFLAELLRTVVSVFQSYPSAIVMEFVAVFIQLSWAVFWGFTVLLVQRRFEANGVTGLSVYLCFSFFWTMQVIRNVVHTTHAGLVATWYFMNNEPHMPTSPTAASLKRAMTTSFGSICLGSLIVALIQTVRSMLRSARGNRSALAAIADCLLGCFESITRYFNHYAFVYCAVYGQSFCQAAQSVMGLFANTGLMPLVNDSVIDKVIFTSSFIGGAIGGFTGYFASAAIGIVGGDRFAMLGVGIVIGWIIVAIALQLLESGVSTIYVCFAEDREALQRTSPELYTKLTETLGGMA